MCVKGVGRNSLQCIKCQKCVQRKYSGINGSMIEVSKTFVHRGCTYQRASVDRTSMHIGDGGSFELVDMFCYGTG